MKTYGKELILDIYECNPKKFTRKELKKFFHLLCNNIDMERCDLHFWDYKGYPKEYKEAPAHLKGTSAIQFIKTSNITVHALDEMKRIYINIFSCKDFDAKCAIAFSKAYFEGVIKKKTVVNRI
tara:strand:- start:1028 stop:1399 length:372 start_codon:yes stop_codon:yes gene_type:complete